MVQKINKEQQPFTKHTFLVFLPDKNEVVWLSSLKTVGNELWLERAHWPGEPTLAQVFHEALKCEIWLFQKGHARCIAVEAKKIIWLPCDLDAAGVGAALERLWLVGITFRGTRDMPYFDMPQPLREQFDTLIRKQNTGDAFR